MEGEMRSDVELLLNLCNKASLVHDRLTRRWVSFSRQRVAHWTGLAVQTVSDYCSGKYNIPIEFWRRILEHCYDPRIVALLLGDPSRWELLIDTDPEPQTGADFFRRAVEDSGAYHEQQKYIAEILADKRIDELDTQTVVDYNDAYAHQRYLGAQLHRGINRVYHDALAAKGAAL